MQLAFALVVLLFGAVIAEDQITCPDGSEIYALGIEENQQAGILAEQNKYRQMALNGEIPNQPAAAEMPDFEWDDNLSADAQVVSLSCKMVHDIREDSRFGVGQNLFISWSSNLQTDPDWATAVKSWYDENQYFTYPDTNDKTLHYTQLVWAKTTLVGCNFIAFYDKKKEGKNVPYARLYSCNYGPAGNMQGEAPYELA